MSKLFNFDVILIFMIINLTIGDGSTEAGSAGFWEDLANTSGKISKTEPSKKFSSANVGSSKTESNSSSSSSSDSSSSDSSSSDSSESSSSLSPTSQSSSNDTLSSTSYDYSSSDSSSSNTSDSSASYSSSSNGVGSDNSTSITVVTDSDENGLIKDEDTINKKTITMSRGSGWNFIGNDLKNFTGTIIDCRIQCVKQKQCTHFTHVEGNPSICYLKKGVIHKNNPTKESNKYFSAIFHRHKTQNKRSTCRSKSYCYGFGDPHYRSIYGEFMNIADKCSYILYSDNCVQNTEANTEVFVDQEERKPGVDFMKTLRIKISGLIFLVGKNLKVDGILYDLPYKDDSLGVIVQRKGQYIVFDHPKFSLSFDGGYKLKMRICDLNTCGLCITKKNSKKSYHEFLSRNSQCSI